METVSRQDTGLAIAGIVLTGAAVGLPHGASATLHGALGLPLLVLGVMVTTVPAFYIAAAYLGAAPEPPAVLGAAASGLHRGGIYLLGLFPALAFLLAAARSDVDHLLLCTLAVAAGTTVGLAAMGRALAASNPSRQLAEVFLLWALVAAGLGSLFFFDQYPG